MEEEMSPPLSGPLQAGCTSSLQEIVNSLGQAMEAEMAAHFEDWPLRLHSPPAPPLPAVRSGAPPIGPQPPSG